MNSSTLGLRVAATLFAVFCLAHLVRLITGVPVTIGTFTMPSWPSAVVAVIAAVLAIWMWWLGSAAAKSPRPAV